MGIVFASGGVATASNQVANTSAYVVDPSLQLVPLGVPGELLIGGDGVARGYLN